MSEEIYRSQFRIPYPLYEALKASADKGRRSVNAELIDRLEATVALDQEMAERTSGDFDHTDVASWISHLESENAQFRADLNDAINNPVVLDGNALAKQVADLAISPQIKALISFIALQAAFPDAVTDHHRARIAIYAASLNDVLSKDPVDILTHLAEDMIVGALEKDLGL
ncbi:Arc family DNA-binding protein [Pseudomonas sp. GB2N2]